MTRPLLFSLFCLILGLAASPLGAQQNPDGILPLGSVGNPLILLLRDEQVLREIKATPQQRHELATLSVEIDQLVWPARNQSVETSQKAWQTATELAQKRAKEHLTAAQCQRVEQVILAIQGARALERPEVAEALKITEKQSTSLQDIFAKTNEQVAALQKKAAQGSDVKPLEEQVRKLQLSEQKQVLKTLTDTQRKEWLKLAGPPVNTSRLGRVSFQAPTLIAPPESWLDRRHADTSLQDKVTAVHFFANGCINCQRNYPHYVGWQTDLMPQGLQIVGIHTPETSSERDVELLRKRVNDAGFQFPVLIDNDLSNWNAWGNSMWPSVYLVDRQGRIRYWWYGELNWQGADGEKRMRQRIIELLAEKAEPATK